jgi:hypothetical protein
VCFTFEDGLQGWGLRFEGDYLLGDRFSVSSDFDDAGRLDRRSLAVDFDLTQLYGRKNQVKAEGYKLEEECILGAADALRHLEGV